MVKPFSPWSTFVWWVLNTKPAIFTQHLQGREINKSSSLSQIFRQQCHFPRSFQRRYIRFLFISPGLLHKMSRQHWSTQLVDCKMLVFQIFFSLFAGFIFSSCWSFCLPFLWCCQPRLFDFCHRMCSSSLNSLKGYHPFHHPSLFCSEALNLYSHNICTGKLAFLFQSCLNSVYKQSDWWKHCK